MGGAKGWVWAKIAKTGLSQLWGWSVSHSVYGYVLHHTRISCPTAITRGPSSSSTPSPALSHAWGIFSVTGSQTSRVMFFSAALIEVIETSRYISRLSPGYFIHRMPHRNPGCGTDLRPPTSNGTQTALISRRIPVPRPRIPSILRGDATTKFPILTSCFITIQGGSSVPRSRDFFRLVLNHIRNLLLVLVRQHLAGFEHPITNNFYGGGFTVFVNRITTSGGWGCSV